MVLSAPAGLPRLMVLSNPSGPPVDDFSTLLVPLVDGFERSILVSLVGGPECLCWSPWLMILSALAGTLVDGSERTGGPLRALWLIVLSTSAGLPS